MIYYLGIDPGTQGGIAMLNADGIPLRYVRMPATERDVLDLLREVPAPGEARAMLEFVRSSPQMGRASCFTFGRGYGVLRMALVAVGIPFDEVTPRKWQQAMGCLTKGDKNVSKRRAQELFPAITVTHALADALLIADYCRRVNMRETR